MSERSLKYHGGYSECARCRADEEVLTPLHPYWYSFYVQECVRTPDDSGSSFYYVVGRRLFHIAVRLGYKEEDEG